MGLPSRSVLDRPDNPYPLGSGASRVWERAKRQGFDITEAQIEFVLGSRHRVLDVLPPGYDQLG